jgi:hypothetical protein
MGKKQQLQETHGLRSIDEVLPAAIAGIIMRSKRNAKNKREEEK